MSATTAPVANTCPPWCSGVHDLRVNARPGHIGDVIHESAPITVLPDRGAPTENVPLKVTAERYPEAQTIKTHALVEVAGNLLYFSPAAAGQLIAALTHTVDQIEAHA